MIDLSGNKCTICGAPTFSVSDLICHRHSGDSALPKTITHIAGICGEHGDQVRQLCSWCGDALLSYRPSMVEEWDCPKNWPIGTRVTVSNNAVWIAAATDKDPDDACFKPADVDTSDFDRYCTEHKVQLGEESEAFDEWLKEIVGLGMRTCNGQ